MKALFLDFDGVLNRAGTKERISETEIYGYTRGGPYMGSFGGGMTGIDLELLERLNRIVVTVPVAELEVVISSSWRHMFHLEGLSRILADRGFLGTVTSATPKLTGHRGKEIAAWLETRADVDAFLILEDGADILPEQNPNWVRTDARFGLTEADVVKSIRILEGVPKVGISFLDGAKLVHFQNSYTEEKFRVRWKDYSPPGEVPFEVSFDQGLTWSSGIEALASVKIWGGTSEFAAAIPTKLRTDD